MGIRLYYNQQREQKTQARQPMRDFDNLILLPSYRYEDIANYQANDSGDGVGISSSALWLDKAALLCPDRPEI